MFFHFQSGNDVQNSADNQGMKIPKVLKSVNIALVLLEIGCWDFFGLFCFSIPFSKGGSLNISS